jgi:hypothetical protein
MEIEMWGSRIDGGLSTSSIRLFSAVQNGNLPVKDHGNSYFLVGERILSASSHS